MTDETIGLPVLPAKWGRLRALAARLWRPRELRPVTAWIVVAVLAAVVGRHFWRDEGELANILFAAAVTAALIAVVTLVARRALFATVVVASLVAAHVWAASAKRAIMNMVVHAYDLFFYLSSWSTVSYMWSDQRRYVVALDRRLRGLGAGRAGWPIASTARASRAAGPHCCLPCSSRWPGTAPTAKGERRHMQFYYSNLYVSSFYASWGETIETLWRGALLEAAPRAGGAIGLHRSDALRCCGPAAAHHPDPPGIGGAAVAVSRRCVTTIRSIRSSSPTTGACTSCGWKPMAGRRG